LSFIVGEVDLGPYTLSQPRFYKELPRVPRRSSTGKVIFAEYFDNPQQNWFSNDFAAAGSPTPSTAGGAITERSFDRALYGQKASMHIINPDLVPATNPDMDCRLTFTHPSNIVGAEIWFTYNDIMRSTVGGQAVYLSVEEWDVAASTRYEGRADYRTNSKHWAYFHDSVTSNIFQNNVFYKAYDDTSANRSREMWNWVKVIVNRATHQWVSIETAEGLVPAASLPNGANLNQFTSDSSFGVLNEAWGIEFAISGGSAVPTSPFEAYYGGLVVTDES